MRRNPPATDTPAFRRWFGKSKVVDASGHPLVVYHATAADFSIFRLPEQRGAQRFGPGFYFTRDLDTLEVYTGLGGSVIPVYLRIEHPQTNAALTAAQVDAFFHQIRTHKWPNGYDSKNDQARIYEWCMEDLANAFDRLVNSSEHFDQAEVLEGFAAAGIDGVIRPVFGHLEYVVFSPSQIKSATGNGGTFDPKDPDIRHNPRRPRRNDSEREARVPVTETAAFRKWFGDSKVVNRQGQPLVVYHGTDHGGFFEFDFSEVNEGQVGFYFTDSRQMAYTYTGAGRRGADPTPLYHETVEEAVLSGLSGDELFTIEVEGSEEDGDLVYSLFDEGSHVGYYHSNRPKDMANLLRDVNALSYTDQKGVYEVYLRIENPLIVDAEEAPWDSIPLPSEDEDGNEVIEHWTTREIARMAMDMGLDGAIIRNVYDGGGHSQGHESGDVFIVFDANQIKSSASNRGTFSREDNDIRKNPLRHADKKQPRGFNRGQVVAGRKAKKGRPGLSRRCLSDDDDPYCFYHATPDKNLQSILRDGLQPGNGETFDSSSWSNEKLFLAYGVAAGSLWQGFVFEMTGEPTALLEIRLTPEQMRDVHIDTFADSDECAFYVEFPIPPKQIQVLDSGANF